MGFIICLFVGVIIGYTIAALLVAAKENDEPQFMDAINNIQNSSGDFKDSLKIIMNADIKFYEKMYDINHNTYYLGRIEECKFVLRLIEGKEKIEIRKSES
jgi:hypothetical protein|nr:MAG TPA: Protein of unknown function (DUF3789) [Caudoviricetes sp.]